MVRVIRASLSLVSPVIMLFMGAAKRPVYAWRPGMRMRGGGSGSQLEGKPVWAWECGSRLGSAHAKMPSGSGIEYERDRQAARWRGVGA
eukprot:scaffold244628_cov28-Tisochrysis_lutea.AAC.2